MKMVLMDLFYKISRVRWVALAGFACRTAALFGALMDELFFQTLGPNRIETRQSKL